MKQQTLTAVIVGTGISLSLLTGCESTATTRPSADDRQDQAMKDPFGYSPYGEQRDVSGGDTGNFDKKGMKHDLDSFFNP